MRVTVFGCGYVGLVTGACLAETGNHVVCVDVDSAKVGRLARGEVPIYEPGLEDLVEHNLESGRLRFTTDASAAVSHGEVIFVAVGTPPSEDGSADISHVVEVAATIGRHLEHRAIIVVKSTVPVGTTERVDETLRGALEERGSTIDFAAVSNPEFLKEGGAVEDCMRPDRIIVGSDAPWAIERLRSLYAPFNRNRDRFLVMDVRSAELTKYAANAMLATRISLMNELANLAEKLGADVECVRQGIGADPRIGHAFIYPGAGFGGSCFPKDLRALQRAAEQADAPYRVLEAVQETNRAQKRRLFEKIDAHFDGRLSGRVFALWGLAFKPNTDDVREAASRTLMDSLLEAGARIRAYDPAARDAAGAIYGRRDDLILCDSAEEALEGADALVLVTEWQEFRSPDHELLAARLAERVVFDGRNIYDAERMEAAGIAYYGIGRGR